MRRLEKRHTYMEMVLRVPTRCRYKFFCSDKFSVKSPQSARLVVEHRRLEGETLGGTAKDMQML